MRSRVEMAKRSAILKVRSQGIILERTAPSVRIWPLALSTLPLEARTLGMGWGRWANQSGAGLVAG